MLSVMASVLQEEPFSAKTEGVGMMAQLLAP